MAWQWGNAGEWAAALGTSAAVVITSLTIRRDHKDRREAAARKVVPVVRFLRPSSSLPPERIAGEIWNDGQDEVIDLNFEMRHIATGELIGPYHRDRIRPGEHAALLQANVGMADPTSESLGFVLAVTFTDAGGRRWLRDSRGVLKRVGRTRRPWVTAGSQRTLDNPGSGETG